MAFQRIVVIAFVAMGLMGCGTTSTNDTALPATRERIVPSELLGQMDVAALKHPTFRLEMLDGDGVVVLSGEVDLRPPTRGALRGGSHDDDEVVFVGNVAYGRPLSPPDAKWSRLPGEFVEQFAAMGTVAELYKELRAGTVRIRSLGSRMNDGESIQLYEWVVDIRKAAAANGSLDEITPDMPRDVTYQIGLDARMLMKTMRVVSPPSDTVLEISRWGEPVDIKLPPKPQIE